MSRITEFARGKPCQIRLPQICNFNPETSVWAHANGSAAGKGIGMKSLDALGSIACADCHDAIDGRRPTPFSRDALRLYFWEGHARSLRMLIEVGLVKF